MYLSSGANGGFHAWRQRFPGGQPEQITTGLTQEEGIAMAPDGRSFITSVGLRQSVVWMHDSTGDRQISLEGYSYDPRFTPDGKRLCYRILKGISPMSDSGDLRIVELDSGHTESFLPGLGVTGQPGKAYDISPDGQYIVAAVPDREGKPRLWLGALDQQSPPHQISNIEGDMPFFAPDGEIVFRAIEGPSAFAYAVNLNGTGLRKLVEQPIAGVNGISSNGEWFISKISGEQGPITMAFAVSGGRPLPVLSAGASVGYNHFTWSRNAVLISVSGSDPGSTSGRTYVVPVPNGKTLPQIPTGGFQSESEISRLRGVRIIDAYDVAPGPTSDVYAFSRTSTQRNLYRIPIAR